MTRRIFWTRVALTIGAVILAIGSVYVLARMFPPPPTIAAPAAQETRIAAIDRRVETLGMLVRHPGPLLSGTAKLIRLGELRSVRRIINILA